MTKTEQNPGPDRVAIVIATHQHCYPLERCIRQHRDLLQDPAALVFVDNGSGGSLAAWARETFPGITIIESDRNGFFCGGYNAGLKEALRRGFDFVLIVNADTDVDNPGFLSTLVSVADQHHDAAFLGPRVCLAETGKTQNTMLQFPWVHRYLANWVGRKFSQPNRSDDAREVCSVDFLNGVCVLCRADALRDIGLMDEVMGGYVEDADWSWRARAKGWKSLFVPVASIKHHQTAREYAHYSMKSFMLRRNHVYWHAKNGRTIQALFFALAPLVLALTRAVGATMTRRNARLHWHYLGRFFVASFGIILQREPGTWFGPPLGAFSRSE